MLPQACTTTLPSGTATLNRSICRLFLASTDSRPARRFILPQSTRDFIGTQSWRVCRHKCERRKVYVLDRACWSLRMTFFRLKKWSSQALRVRRWVSMANGRQRRIKYLCASWTTVEVLTDFAREEPNNLSNITIFSNNSHKHDCSYGISSRKLSQKDA